jgi:hypothetical protein
MSINNLVSTATFFKKNNHSTWSWQGIGENEKQIDHIITKRSNFKRFLNVETNGGVLSDHKALLASIKIASHIPKKIFNAQKTIIKQRQQMIKNQKQSTKQKSTGA